MLGGAAASVNRQQQEQQALGKLEQQRQTAYKKAQDIRLAGSNRAARVGREPPRANPQNPNMAQPRPVGSWGRV